MFNRSEISVQQRNRSRELFSALLRWGLTAAIATPIVLALVGCTPDGEVPVPPQPGDTDGETQENAQLTEDESLALEMLAEARIANPAWNPETALETNPVLAGATRESYAATPDGSEVAFGISVPLSQNFIDQLQAIIAEMNGGKFSTEAQAMFDALVINKGTELAQAFGFEPTSDMNYEIYGTFLHILDLMLSNPNLQSDDISINFSVAHIDGTYQMTQYLQINRGLLLTGTNALAPGSIMTSRNVQDGLMLKTLNSADIVIDQAVSNNETPSYIYLPAMTSLLTKVGYSNTFISQVAAHENTQFSIFTRVGAENGQPTFSRVVGSRDDNEPKRASTPTADEFVGPTAEPTEVLVPPTAGPEVVDYAAMTDAELLAIPVPVELRTKIFNSLPEEIKSALGSPEALNLTTEVKQFDGKFVLLRVTYEGRSFVPYAIDTSDTIDESDQLHPKEILWRTCVYIETDSVGNRVTPTMFILGDSLASVPGTSPLDRKGNPFDGDARLRDAMTAAWALAATDGILPEGYNFTQADLDLLTGKADESTQTENELRTRAFTAILETYLAMMKSGNGSIEVSIFAQKFNPASHGFVGVLEKDPTAGGSAEIPFKFQEVSVTNGTLRVIVATDSWSDNPAMYPGGKLMHLLRSQIARAWFEVYSASSRVTRNSDFTEPIVLKLFQLSYNEVLDMLGLTNMPGWPPQMRDLENEGNPPPTELTKNAALYH